MNSLILLATFAIGEPPAVKGFVPEPPAVKAFVFEPPAVKGFVQQKPKSEFVKVVDSGFHVHQCPNCSREWSHSDSSAGDVQKHTCPSCGNVLPGNWIPTQRNVKIVESSYSPPVSRPAVVYQPLSYSVPRYSFPSANR